MNHKPDTVRLTEAVENIATTIIEIIDFKLKQVTDSVKAPMPVPSGIQRLSPEEGWVGIKETAEHLKISRRTLYNRMEEGLIPHVRIGRRVRFKLSRVDEAMNRRARGRTQ
jgi:excisionase family DNA binding protein